MRTSHIPVEQYAGAVFSPVAVYRPANVFGNFQAAGIPFAAIAMLVGVQHVSAPNVAIGGPIQQVNNQEPGNNIPFRRATTFRISKLQTSTSVLTTSAAQIDVTLEGSGYLYGLDLHCFATSTGNSAVVVYKEDAPWSGLDTVVLRDVNGELVNLSGFHLRLLNLYAGYTKFADAPTRGQTAPSSDTANIFNQVGGAGDSGGSFRFHAWVPVGLNRRDLRAILGNQDKAQKYSLRSDAAASGNIYSTSPTVLPTLNVERYYHNYAVPAGRNANGSTQEILPPDWGILHYSTQSVSPSAPTGGQQTNHFLARIGNTLRVLVLVLRANSSRSTAEINAPTAIQLNIGDTPIFVETPAARRYEMWRRYGIDAPNGVYVYDNITDIIGIAGDELGVDYMYTNGLVNAQFMITYPSGYGSTANSLTVLTDDLVIPPTVNIYA
jgi:hypothetical protein